MKRILGFVVCLLFCFPPVLKAAPVSTEHVEAQLLSDSSVIAPGQSFHVGIHLKMKPGWHTYWQFPGESGLATRLRWDLPEGVSAGPIEWPYPKRIEYEGIVNFGYEGETLLRVPITLSESTPAGGALTLKVRADWLVCETVCIPERAELELVLPVGAEAVPNAESANLFARYGRHIPKRLAEDALSAVWDGQTVQAALPPAEEFGEADFFVLEAITLDLKKPVVERTSTGGRALQLAPHVDFVNKAPERLRGVLVLYDADSPDTGRAYEVDVPIQNQAHIHSYLAQTHGPGFWLMMLFAIAGGLILNLMPCVLPVLSIKILSFAQKGSLSALHGWVYSLGVLVSFWILAGVLMLLQSGGASIGWGFQLQSPVFVSLLAILFGVMALNFLGVVEWGGGLTKLGGLIRTHNGLWANFFTGMIAVLVATPCSAPFMGAAVGFALTRTPFESLAIFTGLGAGMSFPYWFLAMNPGALAFIPKPGPWMDHLKKALSVPLFLTCFWLLWILSQLTGIQATPAAGGAWQAFDRHSVQAEVLSGHPVFVDFTAAWCLTCKANEKLVLSRPDVEKAFAARGVRKFKADWTRRNPEISAELNRHGRQGVPLYLLYKPRDFEHPLILPEILTPSAVRDALESLDQK